MTIYGIKGRPRSGKTALGVKMVREHRKAGYFCISNVPIELNDIDQTEHDRPQANSEPLSIDVINKLLDAGQVINEFYKADKICMYISEMMQYAFSRKSTSNTNAMIAYMLSQVGKTNITFIWDAQLAHTVDIILRELTEYEFSAYKITYTAMYDAQIYNNCLAGFYYTMQDKSDPTQKPFEFFWPIQAAIATLQKYDSNKTYKSEVLQLKLTKNNDTAQKAEHLKF